jgi:nitrogen fixation/metabolism regulation signal transduction histidine kinase
MADATQLRQIVMNLVTNASEAIGDKNGVITRLAGFIQKPFKADSLRAKIQEALNASPD